MISKVSGRKWSWLVLTNYPGVFLEEVRKTVKCIRQFSLRLAVYSNLAPLDCKPGPVPSDLFECAIPSAASVAGPWLRR
jgi:hypothetical protein